MSTALTHWGRLVRHNPSKGIIHQRCHHAVIECFAVVLHQQIANLPIECLDVVLYLSYLVTSSIQYVYDGDDDDGVNDESV
jgi:hypothetical protein